MLLNVGSGDRFDWLIISELFWVCLLYHCFTVENRTVLECKILTPLFR